jgi:tetratricopeptide (TPR) repeat protein
VPAKDVSVLFDRAGDLHRDGALKEAERLYRQILTIDPAHAGARHQFGLLRFQQGRHHEAAMNFDRVLAAWPDHRDALYNRATTLAYMGLRAEALASFERLLDLEPGHFEARYNRAIALWHLGRPAEAIADLDHVLAMKRDFAPAWTIRGNALRDLQEPEDALRSYRKALQIDPGYCDAQRNLGSPLFETGRIEEGMTEFRRFAQTQSRHAAPGLPMTPHKARHDQEQRDYRGGVEDFHIEPGARLSGPAVNPGRADVAAQWRMKTPQIVVIDDLLTPAALEALRRFCLHSTIWRNVFEDGYLGAFPEDGFACPLLTQIAEGLRSAFPDIFAALPFQYLWAFKYDSQLQGIKVHADFATVNVNFWITPDDANLDPESGGLVIWDRCAPQDWDFAAYNGEAAPIREFLARSEARPVKVPYRANRAVIFDSDLFHETDRMQFKPGYENRRINITLLYGRRRTR